MTAAPTMFPITPSQLEKERIRALIDARATEYSLVFLQAAVERPEVYLHPDAAAVGRHERIDRIAQVAYEMAMAMERHRKLTEDA